MATIGVLLRNAEKHTTGATSRRSEWRGRDPSPITRPAAAVRRPDDCMAYATTNRMTTVIRPLFANPMSASWAVSTPDT